MSDNQNEFIDAVVKALLAGIVALAGLYLLSRPAHPEPRPNGQLVLLKNDQYYFDLVDKFRQATRKIHAHIYLLERADGTTRADKLLEELANARKRGVDVRISFSGDSINVTKIQEFLTANNVSWKIKWLHAKVVNVDDTYAYVGSSNWRVRSLTTNNELTIRTSNPVIIDKAQRYLDSIWNTTGGWLDFADTGEDEVFITGGYYDSVKNAIDNAKNRIRVIMKFWDPYYKDNLEHKPSNLARALVNAKKRGVDVKVIVDDSAASLVREYLKNNGVPIKLDPKETQSTHVKSILTDNTLYVGSHNWYQNFQNRTGEATIKVVNRLIDDYLSYFDNLWNSGRPA